MHSHLSIWSSHPIREKFQSCLAVSTLWTQVFHHVESFSPVLWFWRRKSYKCPLDVSKLENQNLYSRHKILTSIKRLAPCSFYLSEQTQHSSTGFEARYQKVFSKEQKTRDVSKSPKIERLPLCRMWTQRWQKVRFWIWAIWGFLKESLSLVLALACCGNTEKGIAHKVRQFNVLKGIDFLMDCGCKKRV